jgi:hypothetical protein
MLLDDDFFTSLARGLRYEDGYLTLAAYRLYRGIFAEPGYVKGLRIYERWHWVGVFDLMTRLRIMMSWDEEMFSSKIGMICIKLINPIPTTLRVLTNSVSCPRSCEKLSAFLCAM